MLTDGLLLGVVLLEKATLDDELDILLRDGEVLVPVVHAEKRIGCELEFRSGIDELLDTEDHAELGFVGCLAQALQDGKVTVECIRAGAALQVGQHLIDDDH